MSGVRLAPEMPFWERAGLATGAEVFRKADSAGTAAAAEHCAVQVPRLCRYAGAKTQRPCAIGLVVLRSDSVARRGTEEGERASVQLTAA